MTDGSEAGDPPPAAALRDAIDREASAEVESLVRRLRDGSDDAWKDRLRVLQSAADTEPSTVAPALPLFDAFLTDGDRPVRLRAVKTVVAVAESRPTAVEPLVEVLTERLYDDFYFVRARAAEALGLLARADPSAVDATTARARFLDCLGDEKPAARGKAAKAFAHLAAGDPDACRSAVGNFAARLDDESPVVRFWLATAVATVALDHPQTVEPIGDDVADLLADGNPFVRGRALECLGALRRDGWRPDGAVDFEPHLTDGNSFVQARACWALAGDDGRVEAHRPRLEELARADDDAVRRAATTALDGHAHGASGAGVQLVEDFRDPAYSFDADVEHPEPRENACPNCGTTYPPAGPPVCPTCDTPGR
ncbi:HEAT repeat domain-containing protein [Halostella litorea]|uniref:HEAT repeat domain-containing protein n=1 Tax=Halostella litorea TaxID=2528831 RepID=UPI001092825B|nr:HEAT repeat domain-containing protein [Halostella litorea]